MEEHEQSKEAAQGEAVTTLRRRGLITGAAALAAGLLAKRAAQPVNAATGEYANIGFYALPGTSYPFPGNFPPGSTFGLAGSTSIDFGASAGGTWQAGVYGFTDLANKSGVLGINRSDAGYGVYGIYEAVSVSSTGPGIGVLGAVTGTDNSIGVHGNNLSPGTGLVGVLGEVSASGQDGIGVRGVCSTSLGSIGVQGEGKNVGVVGKATTNLSTGVIGLTNGVTLNGVTLGGTVGISNQTTLPGVNGKHTGTGVGVQGQGDTAGATGVKGISDSGFPIIGNVTGIANTAAGVVGAGTVGPGVQGQSLAGHGLVGTTDAPNGHAGLIGNATHTGGIGLMGIAPNYGTQTVGHAGEFYGNVKIYGGSLLAPVVQAAVPHAADNSYRALHAVTSPEGWIEDFGEGTLTADTATVTLDPDFAALIDSRTLHVFLTSHIADHLHVPERTGSGFVVMATPSGGSGAGGVKRATGAGTFSYRVVAKRKDITGERLAKVTAPSAPKVPSAFTLPETPDVKAPTKKP